MDDNLDLRYIVLTISMIICGFVQVIDSFLINSIIMEQKILFFAVSIDAILSLIIGFLVYLVLKVTKALQIGNVDLILRKTKKLVIVLPLNICVNVCWCLLLVNKSPKNNFNATLDSSLIVGSLIIKFLLSVVSFGSVFEFSFNLLKYPKLFKDE
eukprot:TRINITY_DN9360_c0_g1_i1.p1 TRINITY_DN9360_c0_g1~~TRINITY_DN9360_c0_g1_i1.p1  ORF type:complete len:155 (+),score=39.47 TRINITY_DN9360_c0_g1_i1:65-529(+)